MVANASIYLVMLICPRWTIAPSLLQRHTLVPVYGDQGKGEHSGTCTDPVDLHGNFKDDQGLPPKLTAKGQQLTANGGAMAVSIKPVLPSLLLLAWCACPTQAAEKSKAPKASESYAAKAAAKPKVFHAVKAGSWYPAQAEKLRSDLRGYLDTAKADKLPGRVFALVSPHAGYTWSGPTAAHGFAQLRDQTYRRVIVLGPSHTSSFAGFSVLEADTYRTPLGDIPLDSAACETLRQHGDHRDQPAAWRAEHSVEMQLPFLQHVLKTGFRLIPVIIGAATNTAQLKNLAQALSRLSDAQTLVVVSSDFTHYGANFGYYPFRDQVETRLWDDLAQPASQAIGSGDVEKFRAHLNTTKDTICGRLPILVLMEMRPGAKPSLLHYTNSGKISGDYGSSVSYLSLAYAAEKPTFAGSGGDVAGDKKPVFQPGKSELSAGEKTLLLKIARASLTQELTADGSLTKLQKELKVTPGLALNRGAFVTVNRQKKPGEKHPQLRGCIGYLAARGPLHQQIAELAISAGTKDRRFQPMTAAELGEVEFEISILSPMQPVNSYRDIVIGLHGMTLQKDGKRAVFLPQVAPEFGWDRATTLTRLSQKAGLPGDAWKEGMRFEVFTADVFHE